jgi:peptidoglycan/xylan/chitin deacetylase (PgdA/CDA1 family)
MLRRILFLILITFFFATAGSPAYADERQGALVLSFDDGYPNWTTTIAPELAQVGGVATGYVNNHLIRSGTISFHDLKKLQNTYGWEIGTHTYNHYDPIIFVKLYGTSSWVRNELEASVAELQTQGLRIHSLVFPFDKYNKELVTEVNKRLECYRRDDENPIASGRKEDGSIPGVPIDIGHYVPLKQLYKLIDITHRYNKLLFLYGHEVLPDNMFTCGTVVSLTKRTLVAQEKITLRSDETLCLVPDTNRQILNARLSVTDVSGKVITVDNSDLRSLSRVGTTFIVGPCKATRLSDFRAMIEYAKPRLYFRTVHDALNTHPAALPNP